MSANPKNIASISGVAKSLLDKYADEHGLSKSRLMEEAILHHLTALRELPADIIIPPRVIVRERCGKTILNRIKRPRRPTKAMRALFSD